MYAERELKRLGDVKVIVRRRIARRRSETIEQVDRVIVPVRWADRAWSWWKSVSPMAKRHAVQTPQSGRLAGALGPNHLERGAGIPARAGMTM
jgi:hypothetical protein